MSMLGTKQPTYKDGRTKQAFKNETDINQILKRAQKSGTISHLNKHEARYGDFAGFDFFEAQLQLAKGATIFADLPVELRREFNQNPGEFFDYVNDPDHKDRLKKLLPALAEPGRQNISLRPPTADTPAETPETPTEVTPPAETAPAAPAAAAEPPSSDST